MLSTMDDPTTRHQLKLLVSEETGQLEVRRFVGSRLELGILSYLLPMERSSKRRLHSLRLLHDLSDVPLACLLSVACLLSHVPAYEPSLTCFPGHSCAIVLFLARSARTTALCTNLPVAHTVVSRRSGHPLIGQCWQDRTCG